MIRSLAAITLLLFLCLPALADKVELVTGEVLQGRVVKQTDQAVTLEHPVLGRLVIPIKSIRAVVLTKKERHAANEEGASTQAASASSQASAVSPQTPSMPAGSGELAKAVKPATKLPAPPATQPWKSQLTLAFLGEADTNSNLGGSIGIKSERTTLDQRTTIDASFFYSESEVTVTEPNKSGTLVNTREWQTTRNEATAGFSRDWLIRNSPWFWFSQGRLDYAEFRPYRERLSGAAGPGYQLLKDNEWDVIFRLGAGGYQSWGEQGDDGFQPEGSLGETVAWNISPKQKLSLAETFYAAMNVLGRSRNIASADWTIKLDKLSGLNLKLSVQDEYDSFIPDNTSGISHNDAKFIAGLELDF